VAPGSYRLAGNVELTWWDPRALSLGVTSSFGLHRDDLIVKDGDMFAVEERLLEYERWRDRRAAALSTASRRTVRVQTATAWAADAAEKGIDAVIADAAGIQIVALPGGASRPRGPRFGTLVHAVLATVPLDAAEAVVKRIAETHARLLTTSTSEQERVMTQAEIKAATSVAMAVLGHDLMRRARASSKVLRETPVSWVQSDGMLIEGVLDLAFEEEGSTTVVDFKTDHELSAGESRYRAQLQQYVSAVARVTGRPASGILFRV
jgi:ATP-dependent exoDNAse (exonuclease V) beta subunit